jgi:hypothetical protein
MNVSGINISIARAENASAEGCLLSCESTMQGVGPFFLIALLFVPYCSFAVLLSLVVLSLQLCTGNVHVVSRHPAFCDKERHN